MKNWSLDFTWDFDTVVLIPTIVLEKLVFPDGRTQIESNTIMLTWLPFALELSFYKEI